MAFAIRPYAGYRAEEILPLYASAGWTNYTQNPEMLESAYQNSLLALAAYDGGQLVGVIRVVGDGCSIVLIQDILVLPEYQRRGIGTMLMRAVMERYACVYQMQLATDDTEKTKAFYRALGFTPYGELGCCGFMRMNL